jgi:hypothetical protein
MIIFEQIIGEILMRIILDLVKLAGSSIATVSLGL